MVDRESILKKVQKIDDKLIVSKILDKAAKAQKSSSPAYSDFLDPYQRSIVERALGDVVDLKYEFNGGYIGAERVIIIFRPNFISPRSESDIVYPFKVVNITLHGRGALTHRDYLGSLMGLGIKREKIGDILVEEESCTVIVLSEIADFIKYNLSKVSNIKADADIISIDQLVAPEPKVKEVNTTVASLRLDSIAGAGFGMSRSKAAEFIKGEKVSLNWEIADSLTKQVKEGDVISIRGKGRVVVDSIGGTTRKGRISVLLKRLV